MKRASEPFIKRHSVLYLINLMGIAILTLNAALLFALENRDTAPHKIDRFRKQSESD